MESNEKSDTKVKKKFYFTVYELAIWTGSVAAIIISFFAFGGKGVLSLVASIIGATSLIFIAKGNPIGQALTVVFSVIYGIISLKVRYYGEMITYLGMTAPMAIVALIGWLRHPFNGNRAEVKANNLRPLEYLFAFALTVAVTTAFYFILRAMNTANLIPSTISVATSFIAVYLTARRSPNYALGYAANDIVLIVLWVMANAESGEYVSVIACFCVFFVNDVYGFINWRTILKRQNAAAPAENTPAPEENAENPS